MTPVIEKAIPAQYTYVLKPSGKNSNALENCEVCGTFVDSVYHQIEGRYFEFEGAKRITHHKCSDLFGHKDCLLSKRQEPHFSNI